MAYATIQDMNDRYGALYLLASADRDQDSILDEVAAHKALEDASSLIDSYLSTQMSVPVKPVPSVLIEKTVDIALYKLSADTGPYMKEKRVRYDDALAWLSAIAKGELGLSLKPDTPPLEFSPMKTTSSPRLFHRASLRGVL